MTTATKLKRLPERVPVVDTKTGLMTQPWLDFFRLQIKGAADTNADVLDEKASLVSGTTGNMIKIAGTSGELEDTGSPAPSGDVVGTTDTQTMSNKTITAPSIVGGEASDIYLTGYPVVDSDKWNFMNHTHAGTTTGGLVVAAKMYLYTYTGDAGTTKAITGFGFQPTAVISFGYLGWSIGAISIKTSDMAGQTSFNFSIGDSNLAAYQNSGVQSLDADGITVNNSAIAGTTHHLNKSGTIYYGIAFG